MTGQARRDGPEAEPITLVAALDRATRRLRAAGVGSPRIDSQVLLGAAAGLSREDILRDGHRPLPGAVGKRFEALVARRAGRQPVAQIIGRREFWSLSFEVTGNVLCPRPDSETVIEAALAALGPDPSDLAISILDLGTGGGCLLLALLHEMPLARGIGLDICDKALAVAQRNAAALAVDARARFIRADWRQPGDSGLASVLAAAPFDLVVCNPPYVRDADIDGLAPEVARFEPRRALAGGTDGMDAYRVLGGLLPALLTPGGSAIFEVGAGQSRDVAAILEGRKMKIMRLWSDLNGIERCISVKNRSEKGEEIDRPPSAP